MTTAKSFDFCKNCGIFKYSPVSTIQWDM